MTSPWVRFLGRCSSNRYGYSSQATVASQRRSAAAPLGGSRTTGPKKHSGFAVVVERTRERTTSARRIRRRAPHGRARRVPRRGWSGRRWPRRRSSGRGPAPRADAEPPRVVRLEALFVKGAARTLVPPIEVVHRRPAQHRADPHHRPAVGPVAFPRVLLALPRLISSRLKNFQSIVRPSCRSHLTDPLRSLVRERAHDVEVKVHDGWSCRFGHPPTMPQPGAPAAGAAGTPGEGAPAAAQRLREVRRR